MKHVQKSKFLVFLLFCALCISTHTQLKAQFINIPDANFRARLQTLFPACFGGVGGAQLNTACPAVTSAISLSVSSSNIADLTGIGAFTSLQTLYCYQNQLTSLPALPASLQYLYCYQNQLTSLPALPTSLQYLECNNNQLTSLPALPASLQTLYCHQNQLASLPALPASLTFLYCYANQLTSLPALPASLQILNCYQNQLMSLPALPASLQTLDCGSNQLTSLPALPASLASLLCDNNFLDFADLEVINPKPNFYVATPQKYTILPATVSVATGGTLSINGAVGGTLNVYKWYKNNVLIVGATSATFTKASFVLADAGVYRCEVTSTFVGAGTTTGVIISSSNVTVSVCPTITFNNTTATSGTVGTAYTLNASATNATSYSISPTLPAGLSLGATGIISGTPTLSALSNTYIVTATQGTCSATQGYTFAVNCSTIVISPATLANSTVGSSYSQTLTQTGLTGTPTWSVSVGSLPAGLLLNASSGVLAGTPTTAGTANFTVTLTNGAGCTQTKVYSIIICPILVFGTTTASDATVGTAYSLNAGVTGSTATVVYSVLPALPAGLSLNTATGAISGTPTALAVSNTYTVTATQGTCSVTQGYTFAINCSGFSITPATLPNGTATVAYNQTLTTNLTGTLMWSVTPALPAGISLSNAGVISGTTAVVSASTAYTVTVSNGICSTPQIYNIAFVTPCTAVVLTPTLLALPNATFGTPYSQAITATGGTANATYTFTTSTPLPSGLTFVNGVISGTPNFSTSVTFVVTAATSSNCSGSRAYTLIILPNPTTALDNSLANEVKVSPNPSSGEFNVDFGSINMAKSSVRVYDTQGKTVYTSENNSNLTVISLENFASGIYLLEVETSKGRILKRLAKN